MANALLAEFEEEMINTRRLLECIPEDNLSWRPHEKSFTLGRLANHLARLPIGAYVIIKQRGTQPTDATTKAELLETFDTNVSASRDALGGVDDGTLEKTVRVTSELSKTIYAALRGRGLMNHLIHHRGQLTVYLRLLNVPFPGMYGPSADEK
jgi:uncharacterized damage-inducible protein DinB